MGEAGEKLRPTVRGWSGEATPRGAGGRSGGGRRGEAATVGPGRGEGGTGRGRGPGPWKDKGQQKPWGLSQDGLERGGRTREGTRTALLVAPSPSPKGRPHLCPRCSGGHSGGAGGTKHRSSCPPLQSCPSSPPPLLLSPRPSELAGSWRERQGGASWLPEPPPLGQPERDPGETPPPTKLVGPQSRHLENGGGRELCQFSPPPSWTPPSSCPAPTPSAPGGPHPHPSESAALSRSDRWGGVC